MKSISSKSINSTNKLKKLLEWKNEEIQAKENEKLRMKIHFQQLLQEKYSTIEMLTRNLHESETKIYDQCMKYLFTCSPRNMSSF